MIAELEDLEKEIDFEEFLDAITNKLGLFLLFIKFSLLLIKF